MTAATRNLMRIISIVIVLAIVLMKLNVISVDFFNEDGKFWFTVIAYGLLLLTLRK
jgi:hypothetical protein